MKMDKIKDNYKGNLEEVVSFLEETQQIVDVHPWYWVVKSDEVWWSSLMYPLYGVEADFLPSF